MAVEYLDLALITAQAARASVGHGWGLVVTATDPPPSSALKASYGQRGQSMTALLQQLGEEGRAAGARVTAGLGVVLVEVGLAAWEAYDGVLVSPLNCREQGVTASGGRGLAAVTVEVGGEQVTARDAAARFPGHTLIQGGASAPARLAEARLKANNRVTGSVQLRVSLERADIRVGDVALYVNGRDATARYIRVTSIAVDEADLPSSFVLSAQIVEPSALSPVALVGGVYWPGTGGAGSLLMRRVRAVERAQR